MTERLRILLGSIEQAGHALPTMALARELRSRGHDVAMQTSDRWREVLDGLGVGHIGPTPEIGDGGNISATVRSLRTGLREFAPDVVVSDALTMTTGLAAEVERIPRATLLPEVYPVHEPGLPLFASGLFPPRTGLGRVTWAAGLATWKRLPGTRRARAALNEERALLGLGPLSGFHGPISEQLTLAATFPQLEYPRRWPAHVHVTGPMMLDPRPLPLEPPEGDGPLVVVASSTVKDRERRLVRVTLEALADERARVLVTMGGQGRALAGPVPRNAVMVDWLSYERVMPHASVVVCNGNHGTLTWALAKGVPVLASPAMPDDAEHGARLAWCGAGLMVPRWALRPAAVRRSVRRLLEDSRFASRAAEIAVWSRAHDGAARGADLVERLGRTGR
jgi:UDP:flavonoid glycosyltransferase YjiC (YdhE family)